VAPADTEPEFVVVARETIELAFLTALRHLPTRQRAALVLRDVLGWSAREAAGRLDGSVTSANSTLQRARSTLKKHLPDRRADWARVADATETDRELVRRYMDALDRADLVALADVLRCRRMRS
jgi:RNA polymerase sigma-70 factor (ECF subfamily)